MPVYNEKTTIKEILRQVRSVDLGDLDKEIIVVDDCSTDGTADILKLEADSSIKVIRHAKNQGKGAAVRTGLAAATGDMIIIQDADLEYDPEEYPSLLAPILAEKADVVFGSRFSGGPHRVLFYWHYVGNRFLTMLSNMFSNLNLTDMETCYKVFRRSLLDGMNLRSNRFGIEPELTAKFARRRARIYEVPISYNGRTYEQGKKIGWKDGFSAIWAIVRFNLID
jgi:glycosyltransferase involved in cell wall biosynthesis